MEKDIHNKVSREIVLNKGLTRRRSKKDKNPRVKRRLAFEKKEKQRKNVVREYAGGHKKNYTGEESGIKISLDRGIKM